MNQSKKGSKLDLKLKVMVVEDEATMRKIIRHYIKQKGSEKTHPLGAEVMPQAIFWLKD